MGGVDVFNGAVFRCFRHDIQTGTNQRISTTSKDLQRLTVVVRRGDKQQKLQVEKLTSDFTHVVQMYSKSQQVGLNKCNLDVLYTYIYSVGHCCQDEAGPAGECVPAG